MLLKEKLTQMQEKLDSLQQRQLQGGIGKGRNAIMKSKFNKFDHINVEIVSGFCKNNMKFLDQSMLLCVSNKLSLCAKLSAQIEMPSSPNDQREVHWH